MSECMGARTASTRIARQAFNRRAPFHQISSDPEYDYFVDGLTEDLITDISRNAGLFVIARNSVFAYKDKSMDVRQIARELGVRYVLEGSARRSGARVRINAQLIDSQGGGHVWAERFDRDLEDIFDLQDEVSCPYPRRPCRSTGGAAPAQSPEEHGRLRPLHTRARFARFVLRSCRRDARGDGTSREGL